MRIMKTFLLLLLVVSFYYGTTCAEVVRTKKPKGTVSFATVLMINEQSEVLLLRRKGASFGDGQYCLPGGKIESGETAAEAACREVQEEVGVQLVDPQLVHVVDRQGPETEFYVFVFRADSWRGIPNNGEPDKCDDLKWFSCNRLPEKMIPAHRQAIERIIQGTHYSEHGW